jgi:hypothetical protein
MPQPASHVTRTRAAIAAMCDAYERVTACLTEYNALGGSEAVAEHWLDAEGQPRSDVDITHAEYVAAVASMQTIAQLVVQGHNTNLYKVKG